MEEEFLNNVISIYRNIEDNISRFTRLHRKGDINVSQYRALMYADWQKNPDYLNAVDDNKFK